MSQVGLLGVTETTANGVCEMDPAWLKITWCDKLWYLSELSVSDASLPRWLWCVSQKEYVPNPIPKQVLQCKTRLEAAWDSNSGDILGGMLNTEDE